MVKVGTSKVIRFSSTSDCQDLFMRQLVVRVWTSMAAVHPGH